MKQFLLKEEPDKDGFVRLRDKDYHYLVNVRRLKPGAVFSALLSCAEIPRLVTVSVQSIDKHILTGVVTDASSVENPVVDSMPDIILFQALPKGSKMDLIVRQAAETGVSEIVPFISEYSVPQKSAGRLERWRRIVKEARQQSGSSTATKLQEALSTEELFAYWEKTREHQEILGLILSPPAGRAAIDGGERNALGGVFAKQKLPHYKISKDADFVMNPLAQGGFHQYLNNKPSLIALAVGPEGGFSAAEQNRFESAGFKAVSLGSTVLRTETAALAGAAAVKIIIMEREWWNLTLQQ